MLEAYTRDEDDDGILAVSVDSRLGLIATLLHNGLVYLHDIKSGTLLYGRPTLEIEENSAWCINDADIAFEMPDHEFVFFTLEKDSVVAAIKAHGPSKLARDMAEDVARRG